MAWQSPDHCATRIKAAILSSGMPDRATGWYRCLRHGNTVVRSSKILTDFYKSMRRHTEEGSNSLSINGILKLLALFYGSESQVVRLKE